MTGALDPRVRDRIVAESHGNPLALHELPRDLSGAELAFGVDSDAAGNPAAPPPRAGVPPPGAAACRGRPGCCCSPPPPNRSATSPCCGAPRRGSASAPDAATAAEAGRADRAARPGPLPPPAGPVDGLPLGHPQPTGGRCTGRWPPPPTPRADPDRRAWHLAHAALGPDEEVAGGLERSAGRALSHGGLAAAAAFLERSTALTPDPARRARRALDAAQAKVTAGAFDDAAALLATAAVGPLDEAGRARIELLRAQLSFATDRGQRGAPAAARRGPPARAARRRPRPGHLPGRAVRGPVRRSPGPRLRCAAGGPGRAAGAPTGRPAAGATPCWRALAVLFTDGYAAAVAPLPPRGRRLHRRRPDDGRGAALGVAGGGDGGRRCGTTRLGRADPAAPRARPADRCARRAAAGADHPHGRALFTGDLAAAEQLVQESRSVDEVTGSPLVPYGELGCWPSRGGPERPSR